MGGKGWSDLAGMNARGLTLQILISFSSFDLNYSVVPCLHYLSGSPAHSPAFFHDPFHHYHFPKSECDYLHSGEAVTYLKTSLIPLPQEFQMGHNYCVVSCLMSQQHASVSMGRTCSDNFTCCHTEKEVVDKTSDGKQWNFCSRWHPSSVNGSANKIKFK